MSKRIKPASEVTAEDISKLPQWAQTYVEVITRQRDEARRQLARIEDNEPSAISYDSTVGPSRKPEVKYIPSRQVEIRHAGVRLRVMAVDGFRGEAPELRIMFDPERDYKQSVGIFPSASNSAILRAVTR